MNAQIWRFVRLFAMAFGTTGFLASGNYTHDAVIAAVVAALETAYRQIAPVAPPAT